MGYYCAGSVELHRMPSREAMEAMGPLCNTWSNMGITGGSHGVPCDPTEVPRVPMRSLCFPREVPWDVKVEPHRNPSDVPREHVGSHGKRFVKPRDPMGRPLGSRGVSHEGAMGSLCCREPNPVGSDGLPLGTMDGGTKNRPRKIAPASHRVP